METANKRIGEGKEPGVDDNPKKRAEP